MLRIGVLVSGGGTNLQAIINDIDSGKISNAKIVTVISNRSKAYALERAAKHSINHKFIGRKKYADNDAYNEAIADYLDHMKVDLVVMAGFLVIINNDFVKRFEGRIINIHPSLIPAFSGDGMYGLHVHEAALKRGVQITGATVHYVNEITDGGPIILQKAVSVLKDDTPEVLQARVMHEAEWIILPKAINMIANKSL